MKSIIGVDVGGTLIRAARFDSELNMLDRAEQPSNAKEGKDAVLDRLYETIRQVYPESPNNLIGIGVILPGPLDVAAGTIISSPNLPFENDPISSLIKEAVGGPVYIGNDADLAGLAEYRLGAGRGAETMIYLTVSTGVGGGIIVDGKPLIGRGQGGEVGHLIVNPDGPLCGCGQPGHLESYSSGTGIRNITISRLEAGEESGIRERVGGDLTQIDSLIVAEAAQEGDPLAVEVIRQAGFYLGVGIASLMMVINPDRFVIGGGVSLIGDLLFDPMNEAIKQYTMHPRYWQGIDIVPAELGKDVGLFGAGALVQVKTKI